MYWTLSKHIQYWHNSDLNQWESCDYNFSHTTLYYKTIHNVYRISASSRSSITIFLGIPTKMLIFILVNNKFIVHISIRKKIVYVLMITISGFEIPSKFLKIWELWEWSLLTYHLPHKKNSVLSLNIWLIQFWCFGLVQWCYFSVSWLVTEEKIIRTENYKVYCI